LEEINSSAEKVGKRGEAFGSGGEGRESQSGKNYGMGEKKKAPLPSAEGAHSGSLIMGRDSSDLIRDSAAAGREKK